MKRQRTNWLLLIYFGVSVILMSSCKLLNSLVTSELEMEEEFALENMLEGAPDMTKIDTSNSTETNASNKSSRKINIALCDKDNEKLYEAIEKWYGTPYKLGGQSLKGIDCSGLAFSIYEDVYNIKLKRRAMDMVQDIKLIERKELREGDLVFFINQKGSINHVGIYLKEDMFVHTSSSRGVTVSKLSEEYWNARFYKGGRHSDVTTKWD